MINKLIALAARFTIGKHVVAGVAYLHDKADGHRSEINLAVLALVQLLKMAGVIPDDVANGIEKALAAILPVTLADKFSKAQALIESVAPKPNDSPEKAG